MNRNTLLLALLAMPALASARVSPHQIELLAGDAPQIRVSGPWPNTCTPELLPVYVEGSVIDIAVRQRDQICGQAITQYSVTVDPTAASGFGQAPDGVYRVRFSVRDDASQSTLLGFRLLDLDATSSRRVRPEAGFWTADEAGEFRTPNGGLGLMIEHQGQALALTTNTYLLGGQPSWYLAAGALGRSVFNGELLQSIGGQPLWGVSRGAQSVNPVGTLGVEFQSSSTAVAWYAQASGEGILDALELMPISLKRMNFALPADGAALAGSWSLVSLEPNSTRAPLTLRLEYQTDRIDVSLAVLNDRKSGHQLRCPLDPARRDAAPADCRLWLGGAELARFDDNALSRLSGRASDGEALVLVRIGD
ncbi:MAG: hypothetical protein DYH17_06050 [Xanthomonadales bacterium PRO6]|nr:hypothetical protein [Xanthomonadales bacterium]MCE7930919.1 hypothetical protein [Xanthomonadales bacterium PRO6]